MGLEPRSDPPISNPYWKFFLKFHFYSFLSKKRSSNSIHSHLNSQVPETTWAPGAQCARSGTNGQAVVKSLQNSRTFSQMLKTPNKYRSTPKPVFHHKKYNFSEKFHKIIMTSTIVLCYWQYFHKIRKVLIKGISFHRFDIAVYAEPWELRNTLMCQLLHVRRLRVKTEA